MAHVNLAFAPRRGSTTCCTPLCMRGEVNQVVTLQSQKSLRPLSSNILCRTPGKLAPIRKNGHYSPTVFDRNFPRFSSLPEILDNANEEPRTSRENRRQSNLRATKPTPHGPPHSHIEMVTKSNLTECEPNFELTSFGSFQYQCHPLER